MAKKKAQVDFKKVALVAAGGAGANVVMNLSEEIDWFNDNPRAKSLLPVAVGIGLQFLGNDDLSNVGMGMVAVGASEVADDMLSAKAAQGYSRVNTGPLKLLKRPTKSGVKRVATSSNKTRQKLAAMAKDRGMNGVYLDLVDGDGMS